MDMKKAMAEAFALVEKDPELKAAWVENLRARRNPACDRMADIVEHGVNLQIKSDGEGFTITADQAQ